MQKKQKIRLSSNYIRTCLTALILAISLPVNINLLGTDLWGLFGLLSLFTAILLRIDGGIGVFIQTEAASKPQSKQFFHEAQLIYLCLLGTIFIVFLISAPYFSPHLDILQFAQQLGVSSYVFGSALVAFFARIFEIRLLGLSKEVVVNSFMLLKMIAAASIPIIVVKLFSLEPAEVFKWLFFLEVISLLALQVLVKNYYIDLRSGSIKNLISLPVIRRHRTEVFSALKYQAISFLSSGFDLIIATIFLTITGYGYWAIMISIVRIIDALFKPAMQFYMQEVYSGALTFVPDTQLKLLSPVFITSLLLIIASPVLIGVWLNGQIPIELSTALACLMIGRLWLYFPTPSITVMNKHKEFGVRTFAYITGFLVFCFLVAAQFVWLGEANITLLAFSVGLRDVVIAALISFFGVRNYCSAGQVIEGIHRSWIYPLCTIMLLGLLFFSLYAAIWLCLALVLLAGAYYRQEVSRWLNREQ